jgi:ferredoxin
MRVVVDFDLCESNALCMKAAPEVFEVRDDDFLYVLDEHPPEKLRKKVEQAVRQCPKQAISIEEDDGKGAPAAGLKSETAGKDAGVKPEPAADPRSQSAAPPPAPKG